MAITRSEHLPDLESVHRELNRRLTHFMNSGEGGFPGMTFMPYAEIEETPKAVYLTLEIPGMEAKDLDVKLTEDSVCISGERKSAARTKGIGMVRSELRYGKFKRVIPIPAKINRNQVEAEYHNGMLKLTLPKG
ncbi:Hsp20/alpha crystallin family protein [Moorena producens JHB]|uniref:Hsp20/alpha crystallin family protein n=1 Tax=Moorena producens (strain JHB) TaxID=1454205 RepID=A0A1D9G109_MOOP1|nr:Hsp20/alpha crystallin family protein [Moorena producens]AOY81110.1 Hsp20/alpha crystallin family protein [Moorena producens JHB]